MAAVTAVMTIGSAGVANALPGDRAVSDLSPYRLNDHTLEPGCFVNSYRLPQSIQDHLDLSLLDAGTIGEDLHVSVDTGADASVDQVLVADNVGYKVYNTFDTGTINNDPDIDPGQTGTGMNGFTARGTTSTRDTIVCVSDHGDAGQNEPYQQEADGMVSAKNRPILSPKVTAVGVSAITNLKTFKVGFGYDTERWYKVPTYDGHSAFANVTDPNAFPSPVFGDSRLPRVVDLFPRQGGNGVSTDPADFTYDTRRVNDFDSSREPWAFGDPFDGQTAFFKQDGDDTAWTDTATTNNGLFNLLATLTQGDLPLSWSLRPSLGAPDTLRIGTFTRDDYDAWNAAWQAYYKGGKLCDGPDGMRGVNVGDLGCIVLVPGTNSPDPDQSVTVIVNPPVTQPAPTPAAPAPAPIVVNPTPVTVQAPAAPASVTPSSVTHKAKATKTQKKAYAKCVKAASKKHGSKHRKALAKCRRMPH
jgi:hypothetical protein